MKKFKYIFLFLTLFFRGSLSMGLRPAFSPGAHLLFLAPEIYLEFNAANQVKDPSQLKRFIEKQPLYLSDAQMAEQKEYNDLCVKLKVLGGDHCPKCDYLNIIYNGEVKKHVQQKHTHYRPYWCPICRISNDRSCKNSFSRWKGIRRHIKLIHKIDIGSLMKHDESWLFGPIRGRSKKN